MAAIFSQTKYLNDDKTWHPTTIDYKQFNIRAKAVHEEKKCMALYIETKSCLNLVMFVTYLF